jgi:ABC-type multidrug transport system fused ATPase/permease subunit
MQWTTEKWLTRTVAYAPQMSYIRHGSVRDNILFGLPFWKDRYFEVLRQCSLEADLALLIDGDRTEVGENGVNLSGGQKARINLARCVYSRARTLYLDDVLSAVDAHTAQFLIDECFLGKLMRGRTVVLVSHHVDLCLPVSDYVVAIADGKVQQACQARRAHLPSLMQMSSPVQATEELPPSPTAARARPEAVQALDTLVHLNAQTEVAPDDDGALIRESEFDELLSVRSDQVDPKTRQVCTKEHQEVGHVRSGHYWLVIAAAGGIGYWSIWIALYGGTKALSWATDYLLKVWTGDPHPKAHLDYYLRLYLLLRVVWIAVGAMRWVWLYGIGNVGFYSAGTKRIHRDLFRTITNAPLSFFESTPSGRLLNVFSQDVKRLDSQSADDFGRTTSEMLRVIVSAITVSFEAPVS